MAKKTKKSTTTTTRQTSTGKYSLIKTCAFWGLLCWGVTELLSFVFALWHKLGGGVLWAERVSSVFSLLGQVALLICVWIAAWDYVKFKSQSWRVIFWILFALGILSLAGIRISGLIS